MKAVNRCMNDDDVPTCIYTNNIKMSSSFLGLVGS